MVTGPALTKSGSVAEQLGADSLTVHHLIFYDRATYDRHHEFFGREFGTACYDWEGFLVDKLPEIEAEKVIAVRNRMRAARSRVAVSFYPNLTDAEIRAWYGGFEFVPRSYSGRCKSPWMTAYVFPDGGVRPFHSMNFVAGNIREAGLGISEVEILLVNDGSRDCTEELARSVPGEITEHALRTRSVPGRNAGSGSSATSTAPVFGSWKSCRMADDEDTTRPATARTASCRRC
jgi:hypothetical protein